MKIKKHKRKLAISILAVTILILNAYLNIEKLSIYSLASDDYALIDIKWGMSPYEVESATDTEIRFLYGNENEHTTYEQKLRLTNRATKSEIKYHFYDNQLYKISISKDIKYFKKSILNQILKYSYFNHKKNEILQILKNNNKYTFEDNQNMVLVYTDKDKMEESKNIHVILGYKPIVESIKRRES